MLMPNTTEPRRTTQVPFATQSDETRIIHRLMSDGYSLEEIESGFALQGKDNGDFTETSVRRAIWTAKKG